MADAPSFATWPMDAAHREGSLCDAAAALRAGRLVLLPTESSLALSADVRRDDALAQVRRIKGRAEGGKPLQLLVASLDQARELALFDADALRLAAAWPAPLTLVLSPRPGVDAQRLGSPRIALRVPASDVTRDVIVRVGGAVTGTSANRAGEPPVLDAAGARALAAEDAGVAGVVDAGRLPGGLPSTLVAVEAGNVRVLRDGAFPRERIEALLGRPLAAG